MDGTKRLSDITELLLCGLLRTVAGRRSLCSTRSRVAQLRMPGIVDDGTDLNVYRKPLASLSFIYTAHGSNVAVVAAISDAYVTHSDRRTQSWINAEPVFAGNEVFSPGVRGLTADYLFQL